MVPRHSGTPTPSYNHPPSFGYPGGSDGTHSRCFWSDGSASRPVLTLTRPGNIGLSRELRCRFLRTALAQRITLCSELISFPGPVTMTARSALAFLDWLLDHDAQLSRLQTSKATLEASPACLDRGSSFVEALFCDVPIHDLVGARLRSPSNDEGASAPLKLTYFDFHGGARRAGTDRSVDGRHPVRG